MSKPRYPASFPTEGLEPAQWGEDGKPTNLAAAVMDGLEWLREFQDRILLGKRNAEDLASTIERLETFSGAIRAEAFKAPKEGRPQ